MYPSRRSYSNHRSHRIVPNYELPPSLDQIQILRVVVRENVTEVVSSLLSASLRFIFTQPHIITVDRQTCGRYREC